jgi:hypothetical protein
MQLLDDALVTVGFVVGLSVLVTLWFVAAAVLTQRHERARGVRQIERFLAAVADQRDSAATK